MKKLILLIFTTTIILSSCEERKLKKPYIITGKAYTAGDDKVKLLSGICYYQFNIDHIFQDSCNKYNVGDTIL